MATKTITKSRRTILSGKEVEAAKVEAFRTVRPDRYWHVSCSVKSSDGTFELQLAEDLRQLMAVDEPYNPATVMSAMGKLIGAFSYYNSAKDQLEEYTANLLTAYEQWYADRYSDITERFDSIKGSETLRDKQIQVTYKSEYQDWKRHINSAKSALQTIKSLLESLQIKKDMLQSIGAMLRVELEQLK